jgi:hypothetical protein
MSDSLPPSVLNSASSWLPNHFWSWIVLFLGIFLLTYMLRSIGSEKKSFYQDGKWINWKNFKFFIPAWWSQKNENTDQELIFYRADTHYDWYFAVNLFSKNSLQETKELYLHQHHIIVDDDAVITKDAAFLIQDANFLASISQFYRIESTATENQEERIYLDAVWIEFHTGEVLQMISKSSVLNGGIEGPYVEEVIKGIKFNSF